jgi:hypothetical protein
MIGGSETLPQEVRAMIGAEHIRGLLTEESLRLELLKVAIDGRLLDTANDAEAVVTKLVAAVVRDDVRRELLRGTPGTAG